MCVVGINTFLNKQDGAGSYTYRSELLPPEPEWNLVPHLFLNVIRAAGNALSSSLAGRGFNQKKADIQILGRICRLSFIPPFLQHPIRLLRRQSLEQRRYHAQLLEHFE